MEGLTQREKDEILGYLKRIAHAVETMAKKADPDFRPGDSHKLGDLLKNPAATK